LSSTIEYIQRIDIVPASHDDAMFILHEIHDKLQLEDQLIQVLDAQLETRRFKPLGMVEEVITGIWNYNNTNYMATLKKISHPMIRNVWYIKFLAAGVLHNVSVASTKFPDRTIQYSLLSHSRNLAAQTVGEDTISLKIMSYNIWNFNSDWELRKLLIADLVFFLLPRLSNGIRLKLKIQM
jgi:hypothetical protein